MPVTQKPTRSVAVDTPDVDALISRGGKVASGPGPAPAATPDRPRKKPDAVVNLRPSADLLARVDAAVSVSVTVDDLGRRRQVSRHEWILTAIAEKLARDAGGARAGDPREIDSDPRQAATLRGRRRQPIGESAVPLPTAEPVIYRVRSPEGGAA